MPKQQN